ncbi:GDSL esterase/lipase At1g31550-like [Rhodamnia argentea]|uniref:GDSL esterase/lipase At1g31550-like n=1 Tax=Rhodamnia argentea TaxID=178133 RepID=A0A8B8QZ33_9MYRT|nr:GDSL esterase/lipase At1g31550-like [Rhodamnia argentea]
MASCTASSLFLTQLVVVVALPIISSSSPAGGCFDSIISFGDSLADTGNLLRLSRSDARPTRAGFLPYGETYFRRPTGRFSDGRLVIDFMAEWLGLPFVAPYYGEDGGRSAADFGKGVNFAVAGATALDASFFEGRGMGNSFPNESLRVQLGLFKELLPSLRSTSSDCKEFLGKSLVLMGEIGGNDYNYPFFMGRDLEEMQDIVPLVIEEIVSAISELIDLGAATILVPGNFPIGCLPVYLTQFQSSVKEEYDPSTGCLNWLNEFSQYHNEQLQRKLDHLRELHPRANIVYVDYYNAALRLYRSPDKFGFEGRILRACCGGGGTYNYNSSQSCNSNATVCDDPSSYASWDGIHFTEAAYRWIFKSIADGPFTVPKLDISCPSLALNEPALTESE